MIADSIIAKSIAELNVKQALEVVTKKVGQGESPQAILNECRQGMDEVGKKFESGEYFIADLMFVANIFERIMEVLGPEVRKAMAAEKVGKVLIATVKDDIHDIGKNLVASMLDVEGFEVLDLGVDVPPEVVCDRIKEENPDIVALSCLLTSAIDTVEETITEITRAGLRDKVKIIVGGIPLSPELAIAFGADAYGDNAHDAVTNCKKLLGV